MKHAVVIAGGGSTYTAGIVRLLMERQDVFPLRRLVLYDIDTQRQDIVAAACAVIVREAAPDIQFFATCDPKEAFTDIDFVMAHIRAGGLPMRATDEQIPLRHGVVGQETCGPGGMAYGMRSIPAVIGLIDYMEMYSPGAWMLNYSNPASIVAEATRVMRPDSRVINICDMPVALKNTFAEIVGVPEAEIVERYFGLNHFGWWTALRDKDGNDLMPALVAHTKQWGYGPAGNADGNPLLSESSWMETFRMAKDLHEVTEGMLPNTYFKYYLLGDEVVAHANPNYTRANEVMNHREKKAFAECRRVAEAGTAVGTTIDAGEHAEFVVRLARALSYNTYERMLLIVRNDGAIANLDDDIMVEVPCLVSRQGYEPLCMGKIPTFHKGMIEQQACCEKLVVEAYLEQSYQKLLQGIALNKTVPGVKVAKAILDDLIVANEGWWPKLH